MSIYLIHLINRKIHLKYTHRGVMADWIHKEEYWRNDNREGEHREPMDFDEWLDKKCKRGWEVFKISRDFNSHSDSTWCVFRKKDE